MHSMGSPCLLLLSGMAVNSNCLQPVYNAELRKLKNRQEKPEKAILAVRL
jgi:hypothetical protein